MKLRFYGSDPMSYEPKVVLDNEENLRRLSAQTPDRTGEVALR